MKAINICGAVLFVVGLATSAVLLPWMLFGAFSTLVMAPPMGVSVLGAIVYLFSRQVDESESDSVVSSAPSIRAKQLREIEEFSRMY